MNKYQAYLAEAAAPSATVTFKHPYDSFENKTFKNSSLIGKDAQGNEVYVGKTSTGWAAVFVVAKDGTLRAFSAGAQTYARGDMDKAVEMAQHTIKKPEARYWDNPNKIDSFYAADGKLKKV